MSTTQTVIVVAIVALVLYLMSQAQKVTQTVTKAAGGGGTSVWSQLASGAAAGIFQGAVSLFQGKGVTSSSTSSGYDRDGLIAPQF